MLRFFDREVVCISIEGLKRQELLSWFFKNGLDEIICVSDENGLFAGYITYYSLIVCENAKDALIKDCLVLNGNIWENARAYAKLHKRRGIPGEVDQLPVVNEEGYLISFAWYDMDANRELRQLRELSECAEACRFRDIFPQYDRVYIHEFNELAFFFAKYLAWQGIPVIVEGALWEGFFESAAEEGLDYRTLHIYAEGVAPKEQNWIENILRSASVEFECVDTIYEKNIELGIFEDADGTEEEFIKKLKNCEAIVIGGTGEAAVETYDYLLSKGLDILGFVNDDTKERRSTLFGKKILSAYDIHASELDIAWINPLEKGSAWNGADSFEYLGYKRNDRYFMLHDYTEPKNEGLLHILKGHRIVCMGEPLICRKLIQELKDKTELQECTFEYKELDELDKGGLDEETFILYGMIRGIGSYAEKRKEKFCEQLYAHNTFHYCEYFSTIHSFISLLKGHKETLALKPKKVILGSAESCSGNWFIKELLDGHPDILMINYGTTLSEKLFWICIGLSALNPKSIAGAFQQILQLWKEKEESECSNVQAITCRLQYLLEKYAGEHVSSVELFIMFHMAYQYVFYNWEGNLETSVIYWEPHLFPRSREEELTQWLKCAGIQCDICMVVRNSLSRNGSALRRPWMQELAAKDEMGFNQTAYSIGLGEIQRAEFFERPQYENCNRIVVRFEDLKLKPEEELRKLCRLWDIAWSDILMHPSYYGKTQGYAHGEAYKKTGFDLEPVYNTYEVYFSELDRLRIALFCSLWQREFNYPYVELSTFTRRELQELFLKPFRFEKNLENYSKKQKTMFKIKQISYVRRELQEIRRLDNAIKSRKR